MKVFLSWSGDQSHKFAKAFYEWLPAALDSVTPWLSSEAISKGATWLQDVKNAIGESGGLGIFFLTEESQSSPWLLFEAGAISAFEQSKVCTVLIGIDKANSPLDQFQATRLTREEIFKLLLDINDRHSQPVDKSILSRRFKDVWPTLAKAIASAQQSADGKRTPYPFPFPSLASGDKEMARVVSRKLIEAVDRDLKLSRYYRKNQTLEFKLEKINGETKLSIIFEADLVPIDDVATVKVPRIVQPPAGVLRCDSIYRVNGDKVAGSETEINEESHDEFQVHYWISEQFEKIEDAHIWPCPVYDYKIHFTGGSGYDLEVSRLKIGEFDHSLPLQTDPKGRKVFASKASAFTSQVLRWTVRRSEPPISC